MGVSLRVSILITGWYGKKSSEGLLRRCRPYVVINIASRRVLDFRAINYEEEK